MPQPIGVVDGVGPGAHAIRDEYAERYMGRLVAGAGTARLREVRGERARCLRRLVLRYA
ncbi:hypothetical protein AB0K51_31445 [Kitasatospora sp. NPDC049285]|uniref:hypothetical protein n=1 Tax=Kitasatospora sp. NPDC049285 TaxID=3157096 RepID=UPI00341AE609